MKKAEATISRAWWAVVIFFLLHGLIVATWVSRIPAVQFALHLNNGVLGLCLLGIAIGSVAAIPVTGGLIVRHGSKCLTRWTTFGFCAALALPAFAVNALTLTLSLVVLGVFAGAMDVSMNAHGVEVEKALGKPTMSRFHAMFSIGGMVGASIGGIVASRHIVPWLHFVPVVLICIAVAAWWAPALLDHEEADHVVQEHRLPWNKIPPVLLALSAIGFCILLSEGAMADWIAVYLKQVLSAGPGTAAAGYAVFSAAMAIFRLLGDFITERLGPARTVRAGSLVASAGLTFALLAPRPEWAFPGLAATGAGLSVIIPLVFGAGGRVDSIKPGAGIATVTGLGYIGFLIGPPAIGFLSQWLTLRYALVLVVVLCLLSAVLSTAVSRTEKHSVVTV